VSEAAPFPWNDAMAFAFTILRWSPADFWRATPRELMAAYEGLTGGRDIPASRVDLARLMKAFPDR
jgi:uncharacterized phage protein (TIGR02216 family)